MMMTNANEAQTRKPNRRASKLGDIKYLLGTLSIAGTLGLWSYFSNAEALPAQAEDAQAAGLNLAPLPTLVSLNLDGAPAQPAAAAEQRAVQELRSVSMPTSAPATSNSGPRIVGGNRSSSGPVTSTRAS